MSTTQFTTGQHILFASLDGAVKDFARATFDQAMSASNEPFLALEELLRSRLSPEDFRAALKLMEAIDSETIIAFEGALA